MVEKGRGKPKYGEIKQIRKDLDDSRIDYS